MKRKERCPKCLSGRIVTNARVVEGTIGGESKISVEVHESSDALLFRKPHESGVRAWFCGDCGYMETYVDHPQELYKIYKNTQKYLADNDIEKIGNLSLTSDSGMSGNLSVTSHEGGELSFTDEEKEE